VEHHYGDDDERDTAAISTDHRRTVGRSGGIMLHSGKSARRTRSRELRLSPAAIKIARIPDEAVTIAQVFKSMGYATASSPTNTPRSAHAASHK
jgi:hypothetical protein